MFLAMGVGQNRRRDRQRHRNFVQLNLILLFALLLSCFRVFFVGSLKKVSCMHYLDAN